MPLDLNKRCMQLGDRLSELIAMLEIVFRDAGNRRSQISQYVCEQSEVDVHMDRLAHIISARPFEDQRDTRRIEMRLKSR